MYINSGLTWDKPLVSAQAGWQSLNEGLRGGVERDMWDGKLRRERVVEDNDQVGEGGLVERGEESASERGGEECVPSDG
jgi:hypothetical protein